MAIKISIGKRTLRDDWLDVLQREMTSNQIRRLAISDAYRLIVSTLPFHHRDPSDRMLVAQCIADDFELLSRDEAMDAHPIVRRW